MSHAIESNTVCGNKQASKAARRDGTLIGELFDSLPDDIDGQSAMAAVLCAAICLMGSHDQIAPKALLLIMVYILSRSSGRHDRALLQDVAYSEVNSVTLLDALGRTLVLPIELCETREVRVSRWLRRMVYILISP